MKRPLILVTGLDHSGTTILDLALGVSPKITGLGEALYMLEAGSKVTATRALSQGTHGDVMCSCQKTAATCPIWSQAPQYFEDYSISNTFPKLYRLAERTYPESAYILDSTPSSWRYLDRLSDFDLRVIRITRDVRSWSNSIQKRRNINAIKAYSRWRSRNTEISQALKKHNLDVFPVGYEELAMRPEKTLSLICDWLGVPFLPQMLSPGPHSTSHIVEGNIASRNKEQSATIRYDGSWMADTRNPVLKGALMWLCSRQNADLVYSNGVIRRKA